jgi:hypothetical protein
MHPDEVAYVYTWLPAIHPTSFSLCYFGSVVATKLFSERCLEEPIFQSQQEAIWTYKMHLRSRELAQMQRFARNRTPLAIPSLLPEVRKGLAQVAGSYLSFLQLLSRSDKFKYGNVRAKYRLLEAMKLLHIHAQR